MTLPVGLRLHDHVGGLPVRRLGGGIDEVVGGGLGVVGDVIGGLPAHRGGGAARLANPRAKAGIGHVARSHREKVLQVDGVTAVFLRYGSDEGQVVIGGRLPDHVREVGPHVGHVRLDGVQLPGEVGDLQGEIEQRLLGIVLAALEQADDLLDIFDLLETRRVAHRLVERVHHLGAVLGLVGVAAGPRYRRANGQHRGREQTSAQGAMRSPGHRASLRCPSDFRSCSKCTLPLLFQAAG